MKENKPRLRFSHIGTTLRAELSGEIDHHTAKPIREEIGVACPKCGAPVVKGFGKNHSMFFSCSEYPKCDFSVWDTPTDKKCPTCGGMLLVKKGKNVLYCLNKDCSYKEELPEEQKSES